MQRNIAKRALPILGIFIASIIFVGINFHPAHAVGSADQLDPSTESIQSFDTALDIQSDDSVNVKENIVYDFGSDNKHGIYRDIPVNFTTSLGKISTKITNVSVVDENNQPYEFTAYGDGDFFEIKIGDPNATVTGIKTYVINYTIHRVINFFSDHDELYWNVTGNEWNVPIENISAEVTLPGQTPNSQIKTACYAGVFGSDSPCEHSVAEYGGASFSNGFLANYEGLTIVVGFPKGVVIPPTLWQQILQIASDNWIVVVPFLVFVCMFLLWRSKGRDPEVTDPIIAQYEAPGGLSPAEAAALLKFSEPSRGITAEIIQLAVKGYLKINKKDKDYEFLKLKPSDGLPKKFDQTLFDGLFADSISKDKNSVMLSDLKNSFYTVLSWVKRQVSKSLTDQGLFTKDPLWARLPYIIAAVLLGFFAVPLGSIFLGLIGFISLFISALIILCFGWAMPTRTLAGAKMAKQVLGLKLYLNVAEKARLEFSDAPEKTPERFEKLLPYAIALGVEKEWAKQFEGIYTKPPSWYNDHYNTFSTIAFVNSLDHFHSVSSDTFSSRPGSSASSGGSGFGGGFSGGGFGGGGGGSW